MFKYQANVEASFGFMDVARSIWGEILSPRHNPRFSLWLEFIYLERYACFRHAFAFRLLGNKARLIRGLQPLGLGVRRTYGDPKHVRKAFHKAMSRGFEKDLPILCSAYRRFEWETGTVDHIDAADAEVAK